MQKSSAFQGGSQYEKFKFIRQSNGKANTDDVHGRQKTNSSRNKALWGLLIYAIGKNRQQSTSTLF